jgi:Late embryogenesis abundant protein
MLLAANFVVLALGGCASLEGLRALIQPPHFEQARGRSSEIQLLPVQGGRPAGGATVRLWTTVTNPNPFGLTLSTVQATLLLDDLEAADADFPLGLPLQPRNSETIPLDLTVSFVSVPRLANVIRQAASGGGLNYRLEGIVGIDAGRFGQPTFGPMTLFSGELRARF